MPLPAFLQLSVSHRFGEGVVTRDLEASTGRDPTPPNERGTSADLGAGRESVVRASSSKQLVSESTGDLLLDERDGISSEVVRHHLARILSSDLFKRSDRLSRFLEFSVESALNGDSQRVKEYVVGVHVFDRGPSFDARIDPVVRVEARRLRTRLKQWHETEGRDAPIVIELPTGTYAAKFRERSNIVPAGNKPLLKKTIAVLPFTNQNPDTELEYFSDGLTEELIHALTRLHGLHVVAWPSASRLKGQQENLPTIRERLQVEYILRGSVRRSGERLRMTAQLINASDGHYLWSEAWDRKAADLLVIEQEIAQAIVDKLRIDLDAPALEAFPPKTSDAESHTLYLKGRFSWNKRSPEGLLSSVSLFSQAAAKDPGWPLAWAGLADAHALLASYGLAAPAASMSAAREAAEKALALDPNSAEALTCLALIRSAYDWEWDQAGEMYRRALTLTSGYATSHHWYGMDYLAPLGRFEEATAQMEIAVRLDPLSNILMNSHALLLMLKGQYAEAQKSYEALIAHDPKSSQSWSSLARLHAQIGNHREAIQLFSKARSLAGDFPKLLSALGQTLGWARQFDQARAMIKLLHRISAERYVDLTGFAMIHLGLGEHEIALDFLERAAAGHELTLRWLKVHPAWSGLRTESRFQQILRDIRVL